MKKYYFIIGITILGLLGSVLVSYGAQENYQTYTEIDPNGHYSVNATSVSANGLTTGETAYVYKDFGTSSFAGDFTHKLDINFSSFPDNAKVLVWRLSNALGSAESVAYPNLNLLIQTDPGQPYLNFNSVQSTSTQSSNFNISASTDYFLTIVKNSTGLNLYIYSDSARTNLLSTETLYPAYSDSYRYLYAISSYNNAGGTGATGVVRNLTRFASDSPPPAMQITYPADDAIAFIHDFSSFTLIATNTDTTSHGYNFKVVLDTTSTFATAPQEFSRNINYSFDAGETRFLDIPNTTNLATSTTFYAKLCVNVDSLTTSTCGTYITFKTGDYPAGFKINSTTFGSTGTSTEVGNLFPQIAPSGIVCGGEFYSPANWACQTKKGISEFVDLIQASFRAGIVRIFTDVGSIFPISTFTKFNEDFEVARNASSTISGLTFTGTGTMMMKTGGGYYSYPILTSTTFNGAKNPGGYDTENLAVQGLYVLVGLMILGTGWKILHESSKQK